MLSALPGLEDRSVRVVMQAKPGGEAVVDRTAQFKVIGGKPQFTLVFCYSSSDGAMLPS